MAHSHTSGDAMDASTSTTTMMTPYLHFTGGDFLIFKSITPSSKGALAGAAIFLFFLAVFERYVMAMRSVLEARWRQRAKALVERQTFLSNDVSRDTKASQTSLPPPSVTRRRVIPPFILSQDVARGVMHTFQSLLRYALMLAVMTFQVAYIITIIVGLGVGEVVFGRLTVSAFSDHSH